MREKFRSGIARAVSKTMISAEQVDDLVDAIESELAQFGKREVSSSFLGELALTRLRKLDQVAYVRFASVYRQFRSVEDFIQELKTLKEHDLILATHLEDLTSDTTSGSVITDD